MSDFEEKVRAAFDAELKRTPARPGMRQRVIANAVSTPRTRPSWFSFWLAPPRLAMVGAAAAVVIAAGIGIRVATQGAPITAHKSPTPSASVLAFGKLPPPALHPLQGLGGGPGTPTFAPYFGPANMTWSGQLPKVPATAPVYRFTLPTTADADTLAARLGAKLVSPGSAGEPRTYQASDGYTLYVHSDDPLAEEPTYSLGRDPSPSTPHPVGQDAARAAADAELSRLGLKPSWKSTVQISQFTPQGGGGPTIYFVRYGRLIQIASGVEAVEVDGNGDPAAMQVQVDGNGRVFQIMGVLRMAEQPANYPIRTPSAALSDAIKAPPVYQDSTPPPAVTLTKATLVYTVVSSGQIGYLEPAYLFTGDFSMNGYPNEKRVLIPAVASSGLAS